MSKFLSQEQKNELLNELRLEKSRRYADRIRIILLLDQGETYKNIAKFLFLDETTIANYRKRYKEGGLEGLIIDDYSTTKNCMLNENDLMKLSLFLESQIYISTKDIIALIKKEFDIEYTVSGLTKLLHRMNFSYKKPKTIPGKAVKEKQQKFIDEFESIKQQGKVYFSDSTHPHHNPVISYGWFKKGVEFDVYTNSGRFHLNINGAVSLDDLDIVMRMSERTNADSICTLLKAVKNKNALDKKIFFVMDNARYNHSKKVKELAVKLKITLIYLPPYSPNLNPIERLWKFFKKKTLYNKYFENVEDFTRACSDFFRHVHKFKNELSTILTDNFSPVGT